MVIMMIRSIVVIIAKAGCGPGDTFTPTQIQPSRVVPRLLQLEGGYSTGHEAAYSLLLHKVLSRLGITARDHVSMSRLTPFRHYSLLLASVFSVAVKLVPTFEGSISWYFPAIIPSCSIDVVALLLKAAPSYSMEG